MATLAIGYVRVSTEEQANEGVSLDAQEDRIRAYCQMRGLQLVEVVIDAGVSAGKALESREGGRRVIEALKSRKASAVVALKLDRLFRDCADCLTVVRGWDESKIALHLVDLGGQAVDTSSAMGRFFLTVMAGAAELERNQIRERTRTALAHKRANGECVGEVPYGFGKTPEGRLCENEAEQAVIAEILEEHSRGGSVQQILSHLSTLSLVSRSGKPFQRTQIVRILNRRTQGAT